MCKVTFGRSLAHMVLERLTILFQLKKEWSNLVRSDDDVLVHLCSMPKTRMQAHGQGAVALGVYYLHRDDRLSGEYLFGQSESGKASPKGKSVALPKR